MDGPMGLADSLGDSVAVGLTDSLGLGDSLGVGDAIGLGEGPGDSFGLGDALGLGWGALDGLSTSPPSAAATAEAVSGGTVESNEGTCEAIAASRPLMSAPASAAAALAARRWFASRIRTADDEPCWRS